MVMPQRREKSGLAPDERGNTRDYPIIGNVLPGLRFAYPDYGPVDQVARPAAA
jgi:hypothetical protein